VTPRAFVAFAAAGLAILSPSAAAASSTRIIGGSPAQQAVLRQIVAGFGPTRVAELRVDSARGGVNLTAPTAAGFREVWETLVIGVAFFDRSAAEGLPAVVEVDTLDTGWPTNNASGAAAPLRATASTAAATRKAMLRLGAISGARSAAVTVSTPDGQAVLIRLTVANAATFMHRKLRPLVLAAWARESRDDGILIEVDDAHGSAWADGRTPCGGASNVRPALRGCDPFLAPGLPGRLPPCPD
jgi:hypothetical protein